MSPATVAHLAARYANFILFKDTSGRDRVARSGADLGGVILVRGAEGGYSRWLRAAGGAYDGFLLSTANVFGPQFSQLLRLVRREPAASRALSRRMETVVAQVFAAVARVPNGNPFTNANKALDHWFAWGGCRGATAPRPCLISGLELPRELLETARRALQAHGFLSRRGYLLRQSRS
jgi:dihydrodipicolinate synthase/N-acetylneuraminate lyase